MTEYKIEPSNEGLATKPIPKQNDADNRSYGNFSLRPKPQPEKNRNNGSMGQRKDANDVTQFG